MNIMIFDTEFTALPINFIYKHINLLEVGYIILNENLEVVKENNMIVDVDFQIEPEITHLTGIDNELAKTGIKLKEVLNQFYNDLRNVDILVAHNINCDIGVIMNEFEKLNLREYITCLKNKIRLDSIYIFRNEFCKNKLVITNYKLVSIYNYLLNNEHCQSHRAKNDCYMILDCFKQLSNFNIIDHYWNIKVFFGKHKFKSYREIYRDDQKYYLWFLLNINNFDINLSKYKSIL